MQDGEKRDYTTEIERYKEIFIKELGCWRKNLLDYREEERGSAIKPMRMRIIENVSKIHSHFLEIHDDENLVKKVLTEIILCSLPLNDFEYWHEIREGLEETYGISIQGQETDIFSNSMPKSKNLKNWGEVKKPSNNDQNS